MENGFDDEYACHIGSHSAIDHWSPEEMHELGLLQNTLNNQTLDLDLDVRFSSSLPIDQHTSEQYDANSRELDRPGFNRNGQHVPTRAIGSLNLADASSMMLRDQTFAQQWQSQPLPSQYAQHPENMLNMLNMFSLDALNNVGPMDLDLPQDVDMMGPLDTMDDPCSTAWPQQPLASFTFPSNSAADHNPISFQVPNYGPPQDNTFVNAELQPNATSPAPIFRARVRTVISKEQKAIMDGWLKDNIRFPVVKGRPDVMADLERRTGLPQKTIREYLARNRPRKLARPEPTTASSARDATGSLADHFKQSLLDNHSSVKATLGSRSVDGTSPPTGEPILHPEAMSNRRRAASHSERSLIQHTEQNSYITWWLKALLPAGQMLKHDEDVDQVDSHHNTDGELPGGQERTNVADGAGDQPDYFGIIEGDDDGDKQNRHHRNPSIKIDQPVSRAPTFGPNSSPHHVPHSPDALSPPPLFPRLSLERRQRSIESLSNKSQETESVDTRSEHSYRTCHSDSSYVTCETSLSSTTSSGILGPRKGRRTMYTDETSAQSTYQGSSGGSENLETSSASSVSKNQCPICRKVLKRPNLVKRHMESIHGLAEKYYICSSRAECLGDDSETCRLCQLSTHQSPAVRPPSSSMSPSLAMCPHQFWLCDDKPELQKSWPRRDGFWKHLEGRHKVDKSLLPHIRLEDWLGEPSEETKTIIRINQDQQQAGAIMRALTAGFVQLVESVPRVPCPERRESGQWQPPPPGAPRSAPGDLA